MLYQLSYFRIVHFAKIFRSAFCVGRDGFEPPKVKTSRFTVCPIWPLWYLPKVDWCLMLEPMEGFEPPTSWLQISCSGQLSYIGMCYQLRCKVSKKKWNRKIFAHFFLVSQRTLLIATLLSLDFRPIIAIFNRRFKWLNLENRCKDRIVLWKIKHSGQKICKKLAFFSIFAHTYI